MRALHFPGAPSGSVPAFSFTDHLPPPSALVYTASGFQEPRSGGRSCYLIRVFTTSLTRNELTWAEVLAPSRFKPHSGAIPGHDFIGIVEEVLPSGHGEMMFHENDHVWGLIDFDRDGAAAEYAIALEDELCLAPKCPDDIGQAQWTRELATLPLSALTAWQALFVHGGLLEKADRNDRVSQVIVLGSGAVARAVIELARHSGHWTQVVASRSKAATLRNDYVKTRILTTDIIEDGPDLLHELTSIRDECGQERDSMPVDLIVDTMGGQIVSKLLRSPQLLQLVKPGSKFVTVAAPLSALGEETEQGIKANCETARLSCTFFVVKPDAEQLRKIKKITEAGKLRGCVDSVWPLDRGTEAMDRIETRGMVEKGKVVLTI